MNPKEAFSDKYYDTRNKLMRSWRCNPRPPLKIAWLIRAMRGQAHCVPNGYWLAVRDGEIFFFTGENPPIDRLARTFDLFEAVDDWVEKCNRGEERHIAEINRQCAKSISKLKTHQYLGAK